MKKREYLVFLTLCFLVLIAGIHERYIGSGIRLDIYLFHDYFSIRNGVRVEGRWLSNIINDLSGLITRSSLLLLIYYVSNTKSLRRIIIPFLIISFADIVDYVLFFQKHSHIKLGALLIMISIYLYINILKKKK